MAVYCRRCGAEIPEGSRFCRVCGTPVAPIPPYRKPPKKRKTIFQRAWFWILISLCIAVIIIWPRSSQVTEREDASSSFHSSSREADSLSSHQEESLVVRPPEENHDSMQLEESSVLTSQPPEPDIPDIPAIATIP